MKEEFSLRTTVIHGKKLIGLRAITEKSWTQNLRAERRPIKIDYNLYMEEFVC